MTKLVWDEDGKRFFETGTDRGVLYPMNNTGSYRDWETDRKSTRLNSSHSAKSRMPSSA